jgi:arsenate reductase
MRIFHNPRCAKSREALKLLLDRKVDVEVIEYLKQVPSKADMEEIIAKLGIKAEDLIRKNESFYKENYKGKKLSDSEWIDAMLSEAKLIERPIFIKGDKAVIGRPPEKVLEIL